MEALLGAETIERLTPVRRNGSQRRSAFTATKAKNVATLRDTWIAAQDIPAQAETAALDSRAELVTLLKSVEDQRREIQLAADAEWPHTDEANAGVRKEFGLQPKRPVVV